MKDFDAQEPLELVGVSSTQPLGEAVVQEMGRAYVEEFARMGWRGRAILALFRNPSFRGPHQVWRLKGESWVLGLIAQVDRQQTAQGE